MTPDACDFEITKKQSTTGIITEKLIDLIRKRSLGPGDKLPPERELSEIMGVSRPSLREALKSLEMMSIITIRQGSGAYVNDLDPESVVEHLDIVFKLDDSLYHDLYKARRVLESAICRMAAENITEAELVEIERNIHISDEAVNDPQRFLQLDLELHDLILRASKNRILPVFIQSINKLNLIMRDKTNSLLEVRQAAVADHQRILGALKERDGNAAAQAMENHLHSVEQGFYNHRDKENPDEQ